MTSSNGNTFRVTGHFCGEFASQRPVTRSFDVFFELRLNKLFFCVWINSWVNDHEAGDLRCYRAHYDVIVMQVVWIISCVFPLDWYWCDACVGTRVCKFTCCCKIYMHQLDSRAARESRPPPPLTWLYQGVRKCSHAYLNLSSHEWLCTC